jgi:hypothetical protein
MVGLVKYRPFALPINMRFAIFSEVSGLIITLMITLCVLDIYVFKTENVEYSIRLSTYVVFASIVLIQLQLVFFIVKTIVSRFCGRPKEIKSAEIAVEVNVVPGSAMDKDVKK